MRNPATNQVRRVELLLQHLDALPTLSPVAVRLLDLTTADDSDAKEVIRLVASDPALSSKVLKLCRCHARGRASIVKSVDRAVVLLGFEAVRNAVLSVEVFELFDGVPSAGGEVRGEGAVFDREMFWRHSLAVASASELIVDQSPLRGEVSRSEAYLSGLLHDLGQLVLHLLMPRSFDRVCELAEAHAVSLDQTCRRVIGIDSHTAGKRLAEHWHLPHSLGDILWLHGQPYASLPDLPHRAMIGIVSLADAIVRRQHITTVGHAPRSEDLTAMCDELGLKSTLADEIVPRLNEEVRERATGLGLDVETTTEMLLRSVSRANQVLGRLNLATRQRAAVAEAQARTLKAITDFHASAMPAGSVVTVGAKVVQAAAVALGGGFFAMLYQGRVGEPWQLIQFAADGRVLRSDLIDPPFASTAVEELGDDRQVSMQSLAILPWLSDYVGDADNLHKVQLLPLRCGWGVSAVLLHDAGMDDGATREQLEALSRTWGAALAAAAQHQGAKRLGEHLAEANRILTETQDELARSKAMAALGEVASGAAHEMNNPLAVISGRAQILAARLEDPELKSMAQQVVDQSQRLSDMITAMRSVAEPAIPKLRTVDLGELMERVLQEVRPKSNGESRINLVVQEGIPRVLIDPDQIAGAVHELVRNAFEAEPSRQIELRVQTDGLDDRLKIQVTDQGPGLSEHALSHAFDPFFSDKPAGRQPGLGLARARRLVEAHNGRVTLENGPAGGAVATIWLSAAQDNRRQRDVA